MTTESFMDQIKAFGARLGLPKVDVDKLVDIQLKNIDALGRSAQAAGEGAKALADKQREIIEAAFKETSAMVRDFHPAGDPQAILAKQKDYAKRAFELTMQNTRDIAELTKKTTTDATAIIRDRLRASLTELRDSVGRAGSEEKKMTSGRWRPAKRRPSFAPRIACETATRLERRNGLAGGGAQRFKQHRRRRWTPRWLIGLARKKEGSSLPP